MNASALKPMAAVFRKKKHNFHFCPYKSLSDQISPLRKIRSTQSIILVVLAYTVLHTNFQGRRSIESGEKKKFFGVAAMSVIWPEPFEQLFVPPTPGGYI